MQKFFQRTKGVSVPAGHRTAIVPVLHARASSSTSVLVQAKDHFSTILPAADIPLLCSPIGTVAQMGLVFNLVVCGSSHLQYTMDMVARDYLEDDVLYVMCRYFLILSMIVIFLQIFVEVE